MQNRGLPFITLVLVGACGPGDSNPTTSLSGTTTFGESSSTGTDDPDPTTSGTTGPAETTTGGSSSTGPVDPSTTTTVDPSTTTGGMASCMATAECAGGFCWAVYADMMMGPFECQDVCVDNMGEPGNAESAWCADDAACCNADSVCDEMGYCVPAPPMTTTDTDTDTDGTGTETDTDGTGTDTDTGTGTDTDTDTDTDTGGGVLPILGITNFTVFANCMPAVPPDPIASSWTLTVDNTAGQVEANVVLTKATLTYTPGMGEFIQEINVDPMMVGPVPAMGKSMAMMKKTAAVDNLPNDCSRCGKPVHLELTVDVDGMPANVGADLMMMGCAF